MNRRPCGPWEEGPPLSSLRHRVCFPACRYENNSPLLITLALLCFGLLPRTQAVVPPPDGGYPGFNTAEGTNALQSLTTGAGNTDVGAFSLPSVTEGSFNTATGAGSLLFNTADNNTAFGAAALLFNTAGSGNTAAGAAALLNNTEGGANTANGAFALENNTTGDNNTSTGEGALFSNTTVTATSPLGLLHSVTTPAAQATSAWKVVPARTLPQLMTLSVSVLTGRTWITVAISTIFGISRAAPRPSM